MVVLLPLVANICFRLNDERAIPNKAKHVAERVMTRSGLPVVVKLPEAGAEGCNKKQGDRKRKHFKIIFCTIKPLIFLRPIGLA